MPPINTLPTVMPTNPNQYLAVLSLTGSDKVAHYLAVVTSLALEDQQKGILWIKGSMVPPVIAAAVDKQPVYENDQAYKVKILSQSLDFANSYGNRRLIANQNVRGVKQVYVRQNLKSKQCPLIVYFPEDEKHIALEANVVYGKIYIDMNRLASCIRMHGLPLLNPTYGFSNQFGLRQFSKLNLLGYDINNPQRRDVIHFACQYKIMDAGYAAFTIGAIIKNNPDPAMANARNIWQSDITWIQQNPNLLNPVNIAPVYKI